MAEYTLQRYTKERCRDVSLDEVLSKFFIQDEVVDYGLDVWLSEEKRIGPSVLAKDAADRDILEWVVGRCSRRGGGNNVEQSEFEETRDGIVLTAEEQRETVKRVRKWLEER